MSMTDQLHAGFESQVFRRRASQIKLTMPRLHVARRNSPNEYTQTLILFMSHKFLESLLKLYRDRHDF